MRWWQCLYTLLLCWACTSIVHVYSAPVPSSGSSQSGIDIVHKMTSGAGNHNQARALVTPDSDNILSKRSTIAKKSQPPGVVRAQIQIDVDGNDCPFERNPFQLPWNELSLKEKIYVVLTYIMLVLSIILLSLHLAMFIPMYFRRGGGGSGGGGGGGGRGRGGGSGRATDNTWLFASAGTPHHTSGSYGSHGHSGHTSVPVAHHG